MKNKIKNIFNKLLVSLTSIIGYIILNINVVYAGKFGETAPGFQKAMNDFLAEYKVHISGLIGFGIMISISSFVINLIRLGASSGNRGKRAEAIRNLLIAGICTALLGAVPLLYIIIYTTFF